MEGRTEGTEGKEWMYGKKEGRSSGGELRRWASVAWSKNGINDEEEEDGYM